MSTMLIYRCVQNQCMVIVQKQRNVQLFKYEVDFSRRLLWVYLYTCGVFQSLFLVLLHKFSRNFELNFQNFASSLLITHLSLLNSNFEDQRFNQQIMVKYFNDKTLFFLFIKLPQWISLGERLNFNKDLFLLARNENICENRIMLVMV